MDNKNYRRARKTETPCRWRIYGLMRAGAGRPNNNFQAFHAAAANLRGQGHEVVNPAELQAPDDPTWPNYMRGALRAMLTCEAVVFLPGWMQSNGARLERLVADRLRMPVYDYAHFGITEEKA